VHLVAFIIRIWCPCMKYIVNIPSTTQSVAFFNRHVLALKTGFEARSSGDPTDFQRLYHQQSDICMLHLFESFMESAPQLVLQLYIMVTLETWQSWTGECLFLFFPPYCVPFNLACEETVRQALLHKTCTDTTRCVM